MALSDADANSLIIVGAGGCGMMTALVAAGKGISVLLLEKTDKPGGSTAFSSRGIRAGGSRFQRALDIEYSPEQYARDILGRNSNESYSASTQRLAEVSGPVADFLADVARIDFNVGEFLFGHSARRAHSWAEDKQSATSCGRRLKESLRFRSGSRPQCSLFSKKMMGRSPA